MDPKLQSFIDLIDKGVDLVEYRLTRKRGGQFDPAPFGALEDILSGLRSLKERATTGVLGASEGTLGLGLRYAILDRGTPLDSELLDMADAIECYYQENL